MCPNFTWISSNFLILMINCGDTAMQFIPNGTTYPKLGIYYPSPSSLYLFSLISMQIIALSRILNPHPTKYEVRDSRGLTDMRIFRDESSDVSRTSLIIGDNVGNRRALLGYPVVPIRSQHIPPHSPTMMIGEVLSSSYHQYWWYEMNHSPSPLHNNYVGEMRISISCYGLHSTEPARSPKDGDAVLKEEELTSYHQYWW